MISVIIPSLMRIPRIYNTIQELSICDSVGEIILIDNSDNFIQMNVPKLRHICEGKNTYINPAWNKGVEISKFDKLCFMNDDIWFDWSYLKIIDEFITEDVGVVGMSSENYRNPSTDFKFVSPLPDGKTTMGYRPIGFACCFFMHKKNWDRIPDDLKIWAGDDWLFYRSRKPNYLMEGIKIDGSLSSTLDDKSLESELGPIKTCDMINMKKYVEQGLVENYLMGTKWWN